MEDFNFGELDEADEKLEVEKIVTPSVTKEIPQAQKEADLARLDAILAEAKRNPKREAKKTFILATEGELIQLIIDINAGKVVVDETIRHFFQDNTTDQGVFRGKKDHKAGGRTNGTILQVIKAIVDSKLLYIKKE